MSSPIHRNPFSFLWQIPLSHASSLYSMYIRQMNAIYKRCIIDPVVEAVRPLFFPLFTSVSPSLQKRLEDDKQFFDHFWDPKVEPNPKLPAQKAIRESFICRHDIFQVPLGEETLTVKCCVIEPKNLSPNKECKNLVHALGNTCTADNAILYTYPLLASYLEIEDRPPARFILVSQYEAKKDDGSTHKHRTLEEAGSILTETLIALKKTYGTIQELLAHSVGGIVTASALKHFPSPLQVPTCQHESTSAFSLNLNNKQLDPLVLGITFDRTAASVHTLTERLFGGSFLIKTRLFAGWATDFGKEIADFVEKRQEDKPSITVIGADKDHEFRSQANLVNSSHIKTLAAAGKIKRLLLDTPFRFAYPRTQHSRSLGEWHRVDIVEGNKDFIEGNESLSDTIIKKFIAK